MKRFRFKRIHSAKNRTLIAMSILLILFMGVGYAAITSNLSIAGNTEIASNTWNIHFENLNVTPGSVETTTPATINQSNPTQINYGLTLKRSGDFYEFVVDIKNDGSIPGKVSVSEITGITTEMSNLLDYSITYMNGNPVQVDDILNAGSAKRIRVRVSYKDGLTLEQLPTVDLNFLVTFNLTYVQSEEDERILSPFLQQLVNENTTCMIKYNGDVTDQVGATVPANNVYFNKCEDKRNIIFNNMCWQMIRTTETGGIKLVYNGDVVDGKCLNTRGEHKGIVGAKGSSQAMNASYLYGDSFTYDITNSTFTLTDTITATWSDSTYENLIGKFTCKSHVDTCTTLYYVNAYASDTSAYVSTYTIGDTNYAQIGTSAFNANYRSPAMVGYMFNKVYNNKSKTDSSLNGTYKFGSSFTYDESANTYTLSGSTQNISDWRTGYNQINNTHYTCWNTNGICSTISYVSDTLSSSAYYFDITGGKDVNAILEEMLSETSVNRYNSSIKGIIDSWYKQNMLSKTNMLEDTVYCNARNITNYGTWNPNGGITSTSLQFKNFTSNDNLSCQNETDQFSVSNNKAKLTFPVSLINNEEWYSIFLNSLKKTGVTYWGLSPRLFSSGGSVVRYVATDGTLNYSHVDCNFGSRPAVTLSTGTVISSGTGSETDPWIVE